MAPKAADQYGASELVEAARSMRLDTAKRLLDEETKGKNRVTVTDALKGRVKELESAANETRENAANAPDPETFEDLPQGAEITLKQTAVGPTAAQKEGFTPTPEQVAKAKAEGTVPPQGLTFAQPEKVPGVEVDPHGSGAQRAEAVAAQVEGSLADGEGPYLGSGVGKVSPPAPAFAPGEADPSGSHAAGMTARALGAAPPAPTRFDGLDTGIAPRPEVGEHAQVLEAGGEPSEADPDEGDPDTHSGTDDPPGNE